jgi:hypothetical protein
LTNRSRRPPKATHRPGCNIWVRELDFDSPHYEDRHRSLLVERARLKALPAEPAKVIEHPTGVTVGQVWAGLDDQAKRNYLISAGVQVWVMSNKDLRATPGAEIRYITGDPHKIMGTLAGIVAQGEPTSELPVQWARVVEEDLAEARRRLTR